MTEGGVDSHIHLIDQKLLYYSWLNQMSDEGSAIMGDYTPLMRDSPVDEFLATARPEGLTKLVHVEAAFGSHAIAGALMSKTASRISRI